MFTVGETRPISYANEREQQTQQRWIQEVAGNPRPRRFTTVTSLAGWSENDDLKNREQQKR